MSGSQMMKPSRELSEAVMLAMTFAEHGYLPEPVAKVEAKVEKPAKARWLSAADFTVLEPRALRHMAEVLGLVEEGLR